MRTFIWGIAAITAVLAIYFAFNPAENALFPKCPFLLITGYQCPGCGSQRALHSLLHGEITHAFRYNALLIISLPIVILLTYAEVFRKKKPRLYNKLNSRHVIWGIFIVIVVWWIGRNLI